MIKKNTIKIITLIDKRLNPVINVYCREDINNLINRISVIPNDDT